jgi:hypothetical protein
MRTCWFVSHCLELDSPATDIAGHAATAIISDEGAAMTLRPSSAGVLASFVDSECTVAVTAVFISAQPFVVKAGANMRRSFSVVWTIGAWVTL